VIAAVVALAASIPFLVFCFRSPVLLVADVSLIQLYGESRARRENFRSSLSLFRPVKTVTVADDSGGDIVQFAVAEVSLRPFCVVFPFRFADAARIYREQNPSVLVILLEGRLESSRPADFHDIFVYKTDIEAEFFMAAAAVAGIEGGENGKIAIFIDTQFQNKCTDAFLRVFNELEPPETLFFPTFSQYYEIPDLSCVVLAGTGAEFLETYSGLPIVFFTWIDPLMMPEEVVFVVDDSPWIQLSQAVRMAAAGSAEGLIKSGFLILDEKKISASVLRRIKKMS